VSQDPEIAAEQALTTKLYQRLDQLRRQTRKALDQVQKARAGGSPQNRSERDAFAMLHQNRLSQLEAVEERLYFGSILTDQDEKRLIGRIGLTNADHAALLTDWRAPAAEPFYQATQAHRLGIKRRRHITTSGRAVTAVEDELLDLAAASQSELSQADALSGEGALMAALAAGRTGKMGDIVATIQAEQDRIIRSSPQGALVVQGGPGTGKTAVALHRAAYLLYTNRERLAASGVLIVGPSRLFLRYIDRVLPSLGETGVVATTMADLLPGITASAPEDPVQTQIKGLAVMAKVIRRAVRERQRLPRRDVAIRVLGRKLVVRRDELDAAQAAARKTNQPHNKARVAFVSNMLGRLATQLEQKLGSNLTDASRAEIVEDLRTSPEVRTILNLCWMPIGPQRLVSDLLSKSYLLQACAKELSASQRRAITRPAGQPWSASDVPLLDEAAELLGQDDSAALAERRLDAARWAQNLQYAEEVLAMHGINRVRGVTLADRFTPTEVHMTLAEKASSDRQWTYGHIVIDEAQELTPMDWRCLLRRCPSRSLTIVGDPGQARFVGTHWESVLDQALGRGRWRMAPLTVNYRTPGAVVRTAQRMARRAGLPVSEDTAARELDDALVRIQARDWAAKAIELAGDLAPTGTAGRLAIVGTPADIAKVRAGIGHGQLAPRVAPPGQNPLDYPVALLTAAQTKGLEFDTVIITRPDQILRTYRGKYAELAGAADLYVAMTRPTTKLCLVVGQA